MRDNRLLCIPKVKGQLYSYKITMHKQFYGRWPISWFCKRKDSCFKVLCVLFCFLLQQHSNFSFQAFRFGWHWSLADWCCSAVWQGSLSVTTYKANTYKLILYSHLCMEIVFERHTEAYDHKAVMPAFTSACFLIKLLIPPSLLLSATPCWSIIK